MHEKKNWLNVTVMTQLYKTMKDWSKELWDPVRVNAGRALRQMDKLNLTGSEGELEQGDNIWLLRVFTKKKVGVCEMKTNQIVERE